MKEIVLGLARHLLTAAGGYFISNGLLSTDETTSAIGAALTLIGAAWSVLNKRK